MESGPAIFAGMVFALFGAGLLVWTATRVRHGRPVAHGVSSRRIGDRREASPPWSRWFSGHGCLTHV